MNELVSRLVTLGAGIALPGFTVRTAARSRGGVSLSRKPTAPARSAAWTSSSTSNVVSMTTFGGSDDCAISAAAHMFHGAPGTRTAGSGNRWELATGHGARATAIHGEGHR